jgi:LuxR family maltose regulon positive regulatory protein
MIVLTKLTIPRMREDLILRERLLSTLEANADKRLIFLCAGPGYGKTSLLLQFANKIDVHPVWYSLDERDGNLPLFMEYLTTGVRKVYKGFGRKTSEMMKRPKTRVETIAGVFINEVVEMVDRDLFLILDDYHVLDESQDVNNMIRYLLNNQPKNLHLVISSRTGFPFSIADFKIKGEALEIDADTLKFSREEIRLFLNLTSEREISKVDRSTEGWAAGIYLISQILKTRGIEESLDNLISSESGIFEYFTTQVFELQNKDIQEFLLKSSILEYMTPAICKGALDIKESRKVLDYLYRNSLFVSQIHEHYKYHQLFRDFLIKKAVDHYGKDKVIEFHLRAGRYFAETEDYTFAIEHLIEGKNYKDAARLIERVSHNMIARGEYITVEKWINNLPENIVRANPILSFNKAKLFYIHGDLDSALTIFGKVLKIFREKDDIFKAAKTLSEMSGIYSDRGEYGRALMTLKSASNLIGEKEPELQATILHSISGQYYYLGKYKEASQFIRKALKINEDLGNEELRSLNLHNMGLLLYEQGEFRNAIELYEKALRSPKMLPITIATTQVNLANIYTKQGEYKKALSSLETSLRINNEIDDLLVKVFTYTRMGELYYTMGDKEKALKYYQDVLEYNKILENATVDKIIGYDMSLIYTKERDFSSALKNIDGAIQKEESRLYKAYYLVTKAYIKIEMTRYEEAETILKEVIEVMEKANAKYHLMRAYYYLGLTYFKKGKETERIKRYIRRALTLSEDTDCHHFIIKEGEKDNSLLRFALKYNIRPGYVRKLLSKTEQADLKAFLFGEGRIFVKKKEVREWESKGARSIFLYFIINRGRHFTKDKLIETFWEKTSLKKAKSNLYTTITRIRKALEIKDIIIFEVGEYKLNPDYACWLDTEEFEKLILKAKGLKQKRHYIQAIDRYEEAIKLYKGDFLENIYDPWCETSRRHFSDLYLKSLIELGDCYLEVSKPNDALEYYKKALNRDEYMEEIHCRVMRAYAKMGNRKAVKDQYERLVEILEEELNESPLPRTTRLYHTLIKKRTIPH